MDRKHQTIDLFTEIHQGSQMGVEAIDTLLDKAKDDGFKMKLIELQNEYKHIAATANVELQKYGGTPKEISVGQRVTAWGMTNLQTFINSSSEHLADMMIQGTHMGIDGMHKALNNNTDADDTAKQLVDQFIQLQQKHADEMRSYLH
ncbi:MAG: PA2169 family four-helix-bundle protein [Firmicutes bacterium]|nr:PA2169 family four-helix-bundle protein [Bacillota bacterium]